MKINKLYILSFILFICAVIVFVKKTKWNSPAPAIVEENKESLVETISIPEEILKDVNIISEEIQKKEFHEKLILNGEVTADPDRLVQVSSRIPGRITKVYFVPGTYIKKGSPLVDIESLEASRLRSKYLGSFSKYQSAGKNRNRLLELGKMRLAGEQEIANAETEYRTVEAEWKSDQANLISLSIPLPETKDGMNTDTASKITIRSTISGIAISRNAVPGGQVEPNQGLGMIGDLSKLWFIVKIYESDLAKVSEGTRARVNLNSYPDEVFEGILTQINSQVDATNRTIGARIEITNKSGLAKIGLFGKAELDSISYHVMAIPISATVEIEKKKFVFIEKRPGMYEPREIKEGRKNLEFLEIVSGIEEGEFVVVSGVYTLKAKMLKHSFGED